MLADALVVTSKVDTLGIEAAVVVLVAALINIYAAAVTSSDEVGRLDVSDVAGTIITKSTGSVATYCVDWTSIFVVCVVWGAFIYIITVSPIPIEPLVASADVAAVFVVAGSIWGTDIKLDAFVNITTLAVVESLVACATFAAETASKVDAGLNSGTVVIAAVAFIVVNADLTVSVISRIAFASEVALVVSTCSIVVAVFGSGAFIDVVASAAIAAIPVIAVALVTRGRRNTKQETGLVSCF